MPKDRNDSPNPRRTHTFMSQEDVASGKKSQWTNLEITGLVSNLSPALFDLTHLTSLYLNDNNLSHLPSEICQLELLQELDLSVNKLSCIPAEIGDMVNLKQLLLNQNLIRVLPYEIGNLFQLQTLGLKNNPLLPELMHLYNEPNGTAKLLEHLLDNIQFNPGRPPPRPWIELKPLQTGQSVAMFSVMCYNVLCDKYATRQLYGYCPQWALSWEYRKKGIMAEIKFNNADLISLQEIETEQFHSFFLPEMEREGYVGIFSPKSRARTMIESERKFVDGCAIFFRKSKFSLLKEHLIEFNQIAMASADGSHDMLNRVMTKDNIGLAAMLQTKETLWQNGLPVCGALQPILVSTCHVHWDPEFSDVKLIQTMMLMRELKNIVDQRLDLMGDSAPSNIPLILCGDLNSLPDSGVVEFLSSGKVSTSHCDFKDIVYSKCLNKMFSSDNKDIFRHNFNLAQAYSKEHLPHTNYTFDFKGIIDYVFYSRDHMKPLGVLGPLHSDWFVENKVRGCPHPHIPSDHLPLFVAFEMYSNEESVNTSSR